MMKAIYYRHMHLKRVTRHLFIISMILNIMETLKLEPLLKSFKLFLIQEAVIFGCHRLIVRVKVVWNIIDTTLKNHHPMKIFIFKIASLCFLSLTELETSMEIWLEIQLESEI